MRRESRQYVSPWTWLNESNTKVATTLILSRIWCWKTYVKYKMTAQYIRLKRGRQKRCLDQWEREEDVTSASDWNEIHFVISPSNTELRTTRYMITLKKITSTWTKKKSKTQKSGMSDLVNLRRSDGDYWSTSCPLEWTNILDISLTHKHSFVNIWVSYKSITYC